MSKNRINGQAAIADAREELLSNLPPVQAPEEKPAISPEQAAETLAADKKTRQQAALAEFQELCRKHRVVFLPRTTTIGNETKQDFIIVAE